MVVHEPVVAPVGRVDPEVGEPVGVRVCGYCGVWWPCDVERERVDGVLHPTVACTTCGVPVVPGADGHDQGLDDQGREVFACSDCCRECSG